MIFLEFLHPQVEELGIIDAVILRNFDKEVIRVHGIFMPRDRLPTLTPELQTQSLRSIVLVHF